MAIKLVLLKSGETIISDAKQLVSSDGDDQEKKVHSYIFNKPHTVKVSKSEFASFSHDENGELTITEEDIKRQENEVQITLAPWILLTEDEDIHVQLDWVVTIVDPIESLINMYKEKING